MGSHAQRLLHNLTTLVAFLRGETRIHSDYLVSGTCSLNLKNVEKRAPTGVYDALGKVMVLDHIGDLKVFYRNTVIAFSIRLRCLKVMVTTLPIDLQVCLRNVARGLAFAMRPLLPKALRALLAPQGSLRRAIEAWVLNRIAFTIGQKGRETHVNADIRMLAGTRKVGSRWLSLTDDESIPVFISPQDQMHGLGCTFDGTMHLDLQGFPQLLRDDEVLLLLMQIAIFAILPEVDGMPPVRSLETGETHIGNTMLLGGKKAFERCTQAVSQHLNSGRRNMVAVSLESIFKVILAWERAFLLILCLDGLKHAVVHQARLAQTLHKQAILFLIREKAILKCSHDYILPRFIRIVLGDVRLRRRHFTLMSKARALMPL